MDFWGDFLHIHQSAGAKKWISATPVADYGDSQALVRPPPRRSLRAIEVARLRFWNLSGAGVHLGLGVRFPVANWWAGTTTTGGTYADATAEAQNPTVDDLVLHNGAESGSGIVIGATDPFNILGVLVSRVGDQVAPVLVIEYWNGSAWIDMTAAVLVSESLNATLGERVLAWPLPGEWVPGGTGANLPAGRYQVRVRQTHGGAGTVSPAASQVFVGWTWLYPGSIESVDCQVPLRFPAIGEALFPYFSVADAANMIDLAVRFT